MGIAQSINGGVNTGSTSDSSSVAGTVIAGRVPQLKAKEFYDAVAAGKDEDTKVVQNVRQVGRKAFFRRDQQWIDSAVTPELEKNIVKVKRFSPEYFQLIDKYGHDVAKYLSMDESLTLELEGQAYEIE